MKKIVLSILGLVYIVITVFITIFLLAHNDYNLAEIGDNTYFVIRRDNEKYNAGDLLLINHTNSNNIEANKDIFYYNTYAESMKVDMAKIVEVEKISDKETTYLLDNDAYISSEYVIGSTDMVKVIPVLGYFVLTLESTWGYLLFIVLPLFLMFVFEIYSIVREVREK